MHDKSSSPALKMAWGSLAVPLLILLFFGFVGPLRGERTAPTLMAFIFCSGCGTLAGFAAPLASALEPHPRVASTLLGLLGGVLNLAVGIMLVGTFGFSGLNSR